MNQINVKQNQIVKRGEIIGYVGNTGLSVGPHLHYEVHKDGHKLNPSYFYHNDLTLSEYNKLIEMSSKENQSFD
jgi:murein DD-endopeptidase MepM/ murein hydrolase activator NlpD